MDKIMEKKAMTKIKMNFHGNEIVYCPDDPRPWQCTIDGKTLRYSSRSGLENQILRKMRECCGANSSNTEARRQSSKNRWREKDKLSRVRLREAGMQNRGRKVAYQKAK